MTELSGSSFQRRMDSNVVQKMKMNHLREHSIQSVFVALDAALIIGGSLMTAALMKARGFPDPDQFWHPFALFVRGWGFFLILIPALWVGGSLWLERNPRFDFTSRWTIVTGILVFAGLAWLMFVAVMLGSGAGTIIQSVD